MEQSCLAAIRRCYETLTAAEKRIADHILANREDVVSMSVAELAQKSSAAPSAVVRCCRSLGFQGYSALKIALAADLSKNKQLNYVPYIEPQEDAGKIMDKIFAANIKTLHDTAEQIDRETLQTVVDALHRANFIYIYGIGTSSVLVDDFQYRLIQLGYKAFGFTDVPSMKISTMNVRKGDIAIGISHSGRTKATIDTLRLIRDRGVETACITSFAGSKITQACDHSIAICSDEIQYPVEAISSRIAHISVIDAIAVTLSAKNYDGAFSRAKATRMLLEAHRYQEERHGTEK